MEPSDSETQSVYMRLLIVCAASAIAVFGLLFRTMWISSRGFDIYAFEYWGPRAFGVVVVTTLLGVFVVKRGWKTRAAFGAVGGICLSIVYIWATT